MLEFNIMVRDSGVTIKDVKLNGKIITKFDKEKNKTDLSMMDKYIGCKAILYYDDEYHGRVIESVITHVEYKDNNYIVYFG